MLTGEIRLNDYWNSSSTLYTRIVPIFMFIPVKTYLSFNASVVYWFILILSYYFRIQFWSFLFFRVTFKVELSCLLSCYLCYT